MSERCDDVRQWMLDALIVPLSPEKRSEVEQHVEDCVACCAYGEALEVDEERLTGYVETMQPIVTRLEANVIRSLGATRCDRGIRPGQPWKTMAGRKIARLAATAVAAAIIVLVIGLWPKDVVTGTVYGMSDVPRLMRRAGTIHCRRYLPVPQDLRAPGDEHADDWHVEDWIDMASRRSLTHSWGMTVWREQGVNRPKLIRLGVVSDGRYRMQVNHSLKRVQFSRLSEFQSLLSTRRAVDNFLERVSLTPDKLTGFVWIGEEQVDGVDCQIWQRQVPSVEQNTEVRTQYWLSPVSGQLKRVREWVRDEQTTDEWRLRLEEEVEFDAVPPDGVFATTAPPGYRQSKSREEAPASELIARQIRFDNVKGAIAIIITLPDGVTIMGWSIDDAGWAEHVAGLEPGQGMPKTPLEIECRVKSEADSQSISHIGRYLASTTRDGRVYEWDIHVPNRKADGSIALKQCRVVMRPHTEDGDVAELPEADFSLLGRTLLIEEDEFATFVRGAMAELSDDGVAPDHVTYEFVRQLVGETPGTH